MAAHRREEGGGVAVGIETKENQPCCAAVMKSLQWIAAINQKGLKPKKEKKRKEKGGGGSLSQAKGWMNK